VDGEVVGVNTLVRPEMRGLGNFAISSSRVCDVVRAIVAAVSESAEAYRGLRLVLFNDAFNRRQRVESVLKSAGLSEGEARKTMMDAHTSGRGVVRVFEAEGMDQTLFQEKAEAMRAELAAADLLVELERISQ